MKVKVGNFDPKKNFKKIFERIIFTFIILKCQKGPETKCKKVPEKKCHYIHYYEPKKQSHRGRQKEHNYYVTEYKMQYEKSLKCIKNIFLSF